MKQSQGFLAEILEVRDQNYGRFESEGETGKETIKEDDETALDQFVNKGNRDVSKLLSSLYYRKHTYYMFVFSWVQNAHAHKVPFAPAKIAQLKRL